MAKVAKAFNSTIHRFHIGMEVSEAHDLSPHSFHDLVERGFIASETSGNSPEASPSVTITHGDD